jgi:hypothetical protein
MWCLTRYQTPVGGSDRPAPVQEDWIVETMEPTPIRATLRAVSRRAPDETPDDRLVRLAKKAVLSGVRIVGEHGTAHLFATSGTNANRVYRLDMNARTCNCEGFERTRLCKHLALAVTMYDLTPAHQVTTFVGNSPAVELHDVACPFCRGERGWKRSTGGYLSDWVWESCEWCNGTGNAHVAPQHAQIAATTQIAYETLYTLVEGSRMAVAMARRDMRRNGVGSNVVAREVDQIEAVVAQVEPMLRAMEAGR